MDQFERRKRLLQQLVDELIKEKPESARVKKLTAEVGLAYSNDTVTQMNVVLQAMNSGILQPPRRRDLES